MKAKAFDHDYGKMVFIPKRIAIESICCVTLLLISSYSFCTKPKETNNPMSRDHIIMDQLEHAEKYYPMHPAFAKAFAFLQQKSLSELPLGRHEIDGDRMFCLINEAPGSKREGVKLEAHRKYIDIQYVIAGVDEMGWKPTSVCTLPDTSYNAEKDFELFQDQPQTWTKVPAGSFTIFFPQDAHTAMFGDDIIHKAVLKIAVE